MSHNIEYRDYPENVNKKQVQADWDHYVAMEDWQEGATGLPKPIQWLETHTYESYDIAMDAINRLDDGWYDQLAVKYISHEKPASNQKLNELETACEEAWKEYEKRSRVVYPLTLQAALITCKKCNSKLSKQYLKSNLCPVCHADLRPEHITKSIKAAEDRWKRRQNDLKNYRIKHGKKETRWLVKIEYHT